jgi:hypothetical protein
VHCHSKNELYFSHDHRLYVFLGDVDRIYADLQYSPFSEQLFGPSIGRNSPDALVLLINHLDSLLPGIRLKSRLLALDHPTHQKIADVLASDGLPFVSLFFVQSDRWTLPPFPRPPQRFSLEHPAKV